MKSINGMIMGLAATIAAQALAQEEVKLTSAQDEGIAAIKELGGRFQVDGFAQQLEGLPGLQKLDLDGTKITDAGLAHLKGMTGLQTLDLPYTKVTDAGFAHLKGMTGLESLSLRGNDSVTDAGVSKLRSALPDC